MLFTKPCALNINLALLLMIGLLIQGCTQLTAKDDSIVHIPDNSPEDFGTINDVPDLPPPPDAKKYQHIRTELLSK